jgi:hypothetical protein
MRRRILALIVVGGLAILGTLSGCPAGHDDYPGTACMLDSDCYQGEHCMNSAVCVADAPDMTVMLPDLAHFFGDGGLNPGADLATSDMAPGDDL